MALSDSIFNAASPLVLDCGEYTALRMPLSAFPLIVDLLYKGYIFFAKKMHESPPAGLGAGCDELAAL